MTYKLRDPQVHVISRITENAKKGHKKILLLGATGFGKTIIAKHLIERALSKNSTVLFTVNRISLIDQTFSKMTDLNPSVCQGNDKRFNPDSNFQIATLQTLKNREIKTPDLILLDEVHYGFNSILIQGILERFPKVLVIGLSATPVDDNGYLLEGFDSIVDDYQTGDLIKLGWLVPFKCFAPVKLDLSGVRMSGSDYNNKDLEEKVNTDILLKTIVDNYEEHCENRKFICFAVNKKHAEDLCLAFNQRGVRTQYVTADTPQKERKQMYRDLDSGACDGLISIEILTTGFDVPSVSCVIFACPTKSWKKYIQSAGRGIRLLGNSYNESVENGKSDCVLLDCAGVIEEHDIPDKRKKFEFKKKISKVIDQELKINEINEDRDEIIQSIPQEKIVFLKKIGSLLDLYDGKIYTKEAELQEDVNNFLNKTGWFWWRQNSGKMFKDGRWIHFASKSGLPDNTMFYDYRSIFVGIELKIKSGRLTPHQKETLPEMIEKGILVYFAQSVRDVYEIIKHLETNIVSMEGGTIIRDSVYVLPDFQKEYYKKYFKGLLRDY